MGPEEMLKRMKTINVIDYRVSEYKPLKRLKELF